MWFDRSRSYRIRKHAKRHYSPKSYRIHSTRSNKMKKGKNKHSKKKLMKMVNNFTRPTKSHRQRIKETRKQSMLSARDRDGFFQF